MSAAESVQEPLASTTANPDRTAATVAHSGLQPHPVVTAILAVTPLDEDGEAVVGYGRQFEVQFPQWADPRPIAAKQAAAVLRWLAADIRWSLGHYLTWHALAALADEVEAAGTDNTTRRQ